MAATGWLGSTNGSPQPERGVPERVMSEGQSYARLAGGFAALRPQPPLFVCFPDQVHTR
jgi:hypothetical protein